MTTWHSHSCFSSIQPPWPLPLEKALKRQNQHRREWARATNLLHLPRSWSPHHRRKEGVSGGAPQADQMMEIEEVLIVR